MNQKFLNRYRPICGYKLAAKVCGWLAFWLAGMALWYKFLLEGLL